MLGVVVLAVAASACTSMTADPAPEEEPTLVRTDCVQLEGEGFDEFSYTKLDVEPGSDWWTALGVVSNQCTEALQFTALVPTSQTSGGATLAATGRFVVLPARDAEAFWRASPRDEASEVSGVVVAPGTDVLIAGEFRAGAIRARQPVPTVQPTGTLGDSTVVSRTLSADNAVCTCRRLPDAVDPAPA